MSDVVDYRLNAAVILNGVRGDPAVDIAGFEELIAKEPRFVTAFVKLTRHYIEGLPSLIAELIERRPDCLDLNEAAIVVWKVAFDQLEATPEEVFGQRLFEATVAEFDLSNPEELRRLNAFVAAANALAKRRVAQ